MQKLACTFLYQTCIQIYDQISTLRIWSKVKLHHSISLRFGLKEGKIALNITKFFMHSYLTRNLTKICVHAYLQNGISTLSLRFHLKGVKIARNVTKVAGYDCLLKWVPKSTFKFQFWKSRQKCIFSTLVWPSLTKGQNSSKSHKNRCQCLYLKWVSKSTLKLEFWEIGNNAIF